MDFGELKNDTNFVSRVNASSNAIEKIKSKIDDAIQINTDEMSTEDKVNFDMFLAYAVNSLFFMSLKVDGQDISSHEIKHELNRIKEVMQKYQQLKDKKFRPLVDQQASKRLVKGAMYDFKKKNEEFRQRYQNQQKTRTKIDINYNPHTAVNRKRKFEDD